MPIDKGKLYAQLPEFAKDILGIAFRRLPQTRWAPTAEESAYYGQLIASERFSAEQLLALQQQKLERLAEHAYSTVPYYKRLFDERRLRPADFRSLDALEALPILTKNEVREHRADLTSRAADPATTIEITTGGSTGTPGRFLFDPHMVGVRRAHWWRWSDFAGVSLYGDKMIYVGGAPKRWLVDPEDARGEIRLTRDRLTLSSANMSNTVLDRYLEDIRNFGGHYIRGYASGSYLLARRALEVGANIKLAGVLTSSDTLFPEYREVIERAFGCRVTNFYGQNEDIVTATECGAAPGFHLNAESTITETVDESGNRVPSGDEGRLVGTHLENFAFPLFRYETGDVGQLDDAGATCLCGRSLPKLLELGGRSDEIILTPDGRRVGCGSMNQPMKTMTDSIIRCQYVQDSLDSLRLLVVPAAGWQGDSDRELLESNIRQQVGDRIGVRVELVDDIPARPNGKFQFIRSEISESDSSPS